MSEQHTDIEVKYGVESTENEFFQIANLAGEKAEIHLGSGNHAIGIENTSSAATVYIDDVVDPNDINTLFFDRGENKESVNIVLGKDAESTLFIDIGKTLDSYAIDNSPEVRHDMHAFEMIEGKPSLVITIKDNGNSEKVVLATFEGMANKPLALDALVGHIEILTEGTLS